MDGHEVAELEADCEAALAPIVAACSDLMPEDVAHLMAKAAVAVLEAAVAAAAGDDG